MSDAAQRLEVGDTVAPHTLTTITGEAVQVPADTLVHLQFRRFAGCPICNLHLHAYLKREDDISAAGVKDVVLFHSTDDALRKYESFLLPTAVVGDPDKKLYREFGVEYGARALLNPKIWLTVPKAAGKSIWAAIRRRGHMAPFPPPGGPNSLPADFLIGTDGRVVAAKYGDHAFDQWSADEVLTYARQASNGHGNGRAAGGQPSEGQPSEGHPAGAEAG